MLQFIAHFKYNPGFSEATLRHSFPKGTSKCDASR